MGIGLGSSMEGIRVKARQPRWMDDVAVLFRAIGALVIAVAFLAVPSDWWGAALFLGAVLVMIGARAKSAAMDRAYATAAWSRRRCG